MAPLYDFNASRELMAHPRGAKAPGRAPAMASSTTTEEEDANAPTPPPRGHDSRPWRLLFHLRASGASPCGAGCLDVPSGHFLSTSWSAGAFQARPPQEIEAAAAHYHRHALHCGTISTITLASSPRFWRTWWQTKRS